MPKTICLNFTNFAVSFIFDLFLMRNIIQISVFILMAFSFSSCFTGIEGTKKISLSRDDKKKSAPSPEEAFFSGIPPVPLKQWENGRRFLAADDKLLLIFESPQASLFPDTLSVKGRFLEFQGVASRIGPDGNLSLLLQFSDGLRNLIYDTGRSFDDAMENFTSTDLPMLIDLEMVDDARNTLVGKKLWTRSNLWYDENDQRIDGKKFYPVTILDVTPGSLVFPLKLKLQSADGLDFFMFMNYGNTNTESRPFHNLFSLSDIRKNYPEISPETWQLICNGKIALGMTKLECRLALGNPIDVASGHDYSQTLDIWTFDNGVILWFEDGKLIRHKG